MCHVCLVRKDQQGREQEELHIHRQIPAVVKAGLGNGQVPRKEIVDEQKVGPSIVVARFEKR
jgi:hypothetical protein